MLSITQFGVQQELKSPGIYLDTWALCDISASEALAARFTKALKACGGTLALSWWNVVEFSKISDESQRRKVDAFLDSVDPNIFWLNMDFFMVIKQQKSGTVVAPHSDSEMAIEYATQFRRKGIFAEIYKAPAIREQFDKFADQMIEEIESFRCDFETDEEFRKIVKSPQRETNSVRGTRIIACDLIARFLKDKSFVVSRNNVIDLVHAVVPLAHCDYVLLDGQWTAMAENLRQKLTEAGAAAQIAKVFSKRANGLEIFLSFLEATPNKVV